MHADKDNIMCHLFVKINGHFLLSPLDICSKLGHLRNVNYYNKKTSTKLELACSLLEEKVVSIHWYFLMNELSTQYFESSDLKNKLYVSQIAAFYTRV